MSNNYYSFAYRAKQTVYKWWCIVYRPAYKLFHHGYWPAEKEPYYVPPENNAKANFAMQISESMNDSLTSNSEAVFTELTDSQGNNQTETNIQANVQPAAQTDVQVTSPKEAVESSNGNEPDLSGVDEDVLNRANEILARLAKEAAEDESKKQAEIDEAKQKAAEQEKLANIMKANSVDISVFIEEGKAQQKNHMEASNE